MDSLYGECLKNHAATFGQFALDGCGEFMPDASPESLRCAACSCHRSFHKRKGLPLPPPVPALAMGPPPAPVLAMGAPPETALVMGPLPSSPPHSPPQIAGEIAAPTEPPPPVNPALSSGQKRSRSRFNEEEKQTLRRFGDRLGWRVRRNEDDAEISKFCEEMGITKQVFKVWLNNHKKRFASPASSSTRHDVP